MKKKGVNKEKSGRLRPQKKKKSRVKQKTDEREVVWGVGKEEARGVPESK